MFVRYRTQGLVLKKINRGEADQLFTIYTKDFGKLEILGKGIRKIKSKLRSGAEIFELSEIEFIQGKAYKTLTDAILLEKFSNLRRDLKRLALGYRILEICDNLIKGEEPDEKIWRFLNETFDKLNDCQLSIVNCQLLPYYFIWNFLSLLGYQPELFNCSLCQKKLVPNKLYFSPQEGGVICEKCFQKANSIRKGRTLDQMRDVLLTARGAGLSNGAKKVERIEPEVIKILRLIIKGNWNILSKLKIEDNFKKSLKAVSENYLSQIISNLTGVRPLSS